MEKITKNHAELLTDAKILENLVEIEKERKTQRKKEIAANKKKGLKVKDVAEKFESRLKRIAEAISGPSPEAIVRGTLNMVYQSGMVRGYGKRGCKK